jgi:hypothetical protein
MVMLVTPLYSTMGIVPLIWLEAECSFYELQMGYDLVREQKRDINELFQMGQLNYEVLIYRV